MKQFQFEYKNINNFRRELARVKRFCNVTAYSALFFQLFTQCTDTEEITEITNMIEDHFPEAYYYGCQSFGNIVEGNLGKDKTLIVCSVFEYETTKAELIYIDPTNPNAQFQSLDDLWNYANTKDWLKFIELTLSYNASNLLRVGEDPISLRENIPVFGAVSINPDNILSDSSMVFTKKEGFSDTAAVAILLGGEDLNISCSYYNGWEGLGKSFTITKCHGKFIQEIDNEPAMNIYRHYLNIDYDDNFINNALQFPFLINNHGIECIRMALPTANLDEIELTIPIEEGTKIRLSYGEPQTILNNMNEYVQNIFKFAPETIRIYSCALRRLFWGDENVGIETRMLDGIASTIGFYTKGEILRIGDYLQYFNSTMVTCLVREGSMVEPDYDLEELVDPRERQSEFSSKLVHYLSAMTNEVEGKYNTVLSAIAKTYRTMLSIDLKDMTVTQYDHDHMMTEYLNYSSNPNEQLRHVISNIIIPGQQEEALEFINLSTLDERMANHSHIDHEFIGIHEGWFRAQVIALSRNESGKLTQVLLITQVIDAAKRREEHLEYIAGTDAQTKLYNRRTYENDITVLKSSPLQERLIYIALDINGLKTANDTYGHSAGDELIQATADCMQQTFGKYGKLYRIGGDEFVAIIFASVRQLASIVGEFHFLVNEWHGELVDSLSVSMGLVSKRDKPDLSIEEIEKLADSLMYEDKARYYDNMYQN